MMDSMISLTKTSAYIKFSAFALVGLGSFFASTHAQAAEIDSIWSTAAAWTPANQPNYTAAAGGTLYTDESIAAGLNASALNTDATLSLGPVTQGGGIYANSYLYTGGSLPTFTLSTSNVLSGAESISLSIDAAYGVFTSSSSTLSLGAPWPHSPMWIPGSKPRDSNCMTTPGIGM
jgi:hypothetical protein